MKQKSFWRFCQAVKCLDASARVSRQLLHAGVCERVFPCRSDGSAMNDGLTRWSIRSLCHAEKRWYKFHPLFGLFRLCRGRLWLLLGALLINTVKPQMNGSLSMKWVHVFIKAANPHAFVSEASWGTEQIHLRANCLIRLIWSQISYSVLSSYLEPVWKQRVSFPSWLYFSLFPVF